MENNSLNPESLTEVKFVSEIEFFCDVLAWVHQHGCFISRVCKYKTGSDKIFIKTDWLQKLDLRFHLADGLKVALSGMPSPTTKFKFCVNYCA